jgi:hypothetical protein
MDLATNKIHLKCRFHPEKLIRQPLLARAILSIATVVVNFQKLRRKKTGISLKNMEKSMSIAVLESFGAYHPHHQVLKKLGCSPCERDVFGKIAGLIAKTGKAFICLGEFATDLGYPNCRAVLRL